MTPKEKAIQLFKKHGNVKIFIEQEPRNIEGTFLELVSSDEIKELALISVDEMIYEVNRFGDNNFRLERLDYLREVRKELEKI